MRGGLYRSCISEVEMKNQLLKSETAKPSETVFGFELIKKEYVESKKAQLYTFKHIKTGAELLYFDRADENKTFAISFKTLPEDDTGVFHILEHSVLNGSDKYPVKEPFVSMLQSSMQTFLNAMTYSDKTVYPVSSRNEQDFFNLMSVYLDAVFCPMIYQRPEIFMQEGWHYEFDEETGEPYYNGVVFSEMKGVYAEVDRVIEDGMYRLLFPDNSYGYSSGGHPDSIPELTYEKFIETHKRFYHPSNSKIFLDGHMNIDRVLEYINDEYLSKYDSATADFDFSLQEPKTAENTVYYEALEGEEALAHMAQAKILCKHDETEKIYAAKVLADYFTGSNEAPLKRAFLEKGIAQDIMLSVDDGIYQPVISLTVRNTQEALFSEIRSYISDTVKSLAKVGLNKEALSASLERLAFMNKEISEPYGVEIAIKALDGWLYGDDPLTHIDNGKIFDSLKEKVNTDYFEKLAEELLGDPDDKCCIYALPSVTKGTEDAKREYDRLTSVSSSWSDDERQQTIDSFIKMQQWQQSIDSDEVLATLPQLELKDIPRKVSQTETELINIGDNRLLKVNTDTNGIVYLNLYFDVSDLNIEELRRLNVVSACFGELSTDNCSADVMQTRIKATLGDLSAKLELTADNGDLKNCKPYFTVSASMLEENTASAIELIAEILTSGRYDESDRIYEILMQSDYFLKQSLISDGHILAVTKALSAFSVQGALKEQLEGESFIRRFSDFVSSFNKNSTAYSESFGELTHKIFARNRLLVGYCGKLESDEIDKLLKALPITEIGAAADYPEFDKKACAVEIPASVGFSAMGHNMYAMGSAFSGSCSVLSALISFGYLWNEVRVQGGAYGTGLNICADGNMFCYSYRDPDMQNTEEAYKGMADFLEAFLEQDQPLDDIIIGAVNSSDPLLDPAGICDLECTRYLKNISHEDIAKFREEILDTTCENLAELVKVLRTFAESGKFCAIGDKVSVEFVNKK